MYTEKQTAIISTLLNKWNNRNTAYNSIIISEKQFLALRSVMVESNACGHISYYGRTSEGRSFSVCYDYKHSCHTMVFQATEEEIAKEKEKEEKEKEERYQSAEFQAEARKALARIESGKARAFDKSTCKKAGLL